MLRLLFDENVNRRIVRGLKLRLPDLDYVLAQDVGLKGAADPEVLSWAAGQNRLLITHDLKTVPRHAYERVTAGEPMPGVLAIAETLSVGQAIEELAVVIECSEQAEWEKQVAYLPL
jgi:predicted nuclease of predicted toxin-antitoxin system